MKAPFRNGHAPLVFLKKVEICIIEEECSRKELNTLDVLQSAKNRRVKEWRKLLTKKGRDQEGTYIIEGFHLVEEALQAGDVVEMMIEESVEVPKGWDLTKVPMTTISKDITKTISDTEAPQGLFAVCRKKTNAIDLTIHRRFLLLDRVQDPGNIGTMIRTAEAAGIDAVLLGDGTGDLYNPKVIRSAQGSHFHIDVAQGDLFNWVKEMKGASIPIYGTALKDALPYKEIIPTTSFALIVGNEGSGVSPMLLDQTDRNLYIPIYGKSESLNVAIAAGILLYHLRT